MKHILSIFALLICSTAFGQTAIFTSVPTSHGCVGYPLTWTAQPGHAPYTWIISGTNGTTYTINSGCNSASNTCTIVRHNDIGAYNGGLSIILRMKYSGATAYAIGTGLYDLPVDPSPLYTGLCPAVETLAYAYGRNDEHCMQILETGYTWTMDGAPFNNAGTPDYTVLDSTFITTGGRCIFFKWNTTGTHIVTGTFATPVGCVSYGFIPAVYSCTTTVY